MVFILSISLLIITSVQFSVNNETVSAVIRNLQLAFSRVPIYIVGYGLAPYVKNRQTVSCMWVLFFPIVMWILSRMPFASCWYRGWLLAIPFTMLFCVFMVICGTFSYDKICFAFKFLGGISLESYLANVFVTYALSEFDFFETIVLNKNNYFFYTLVFVIGMLVAVMAKRMNQFLKTER